MTFFDRIEDFLPGPMAVTIPYLKAPTVVGEEPAQDGAVVFHVQQEPLETQSQRRQRLLHAVRVRVLGWTERVTQQIAYVTVGTTIVVAQPNMQRLPAYMWDVLQQQAANNSSRYIVRLDLQPWNSDLMEFTELVQVGSVFFGRTTRYWANRYDQGMLVLGPGPTTNMYNGLFLPARTSVVQFEHPEKPTAAGE